MRRTPVFLFALLLLLVGCQADGNLPASSSPTANVLGLTETPSLTPTEIPSVTLTLLPATPTPDLREYVVGVRRADVWDAPEDEYKYLKLETQLILGEKVLVLEIQGEWSKIAAVEQPSEMNPLGYPGWVRTKSLVQGWPAAEQYVVVMKPHSYLYSAPDGSVRLSLYLDTRLPVVSAQTNWVEARLPDGGSGWLRSRDVRVTNDLSAHIPTDGLVELAKSLAGVPYRWGGTTPDAIDCSGLFYRVFHAYGWTLTRDADELVLTGEPVAREDLIAGDMIFTSDEPGGPVVHVAMYLGDARILDATEYYGVYARSIQEFLHGNSWVAARRYLP